MCSGTGVETRTSGRHATALFVVLLLCGPTNTPAQTPARNTDWYYDIGGAEPLLLAPTYQSGVFGVQGAAGYGLGNACGKFDPTAALGANIKGTVDQLKGLAVNALETFIVGLIMTEIAERAPQLYDVLKDTMWKADEMYRLSIKSCRDMMSDIDEGKNAYEDFVTVSRTKDLQMRANSGSNDITAAVTDANGDAGIPWLGGDWAGGQGQVPINVIGDTTIAGYNVLLGRDSADYSAPSTFSATTPPIVELWSGPQEAREWMNRVLGEETITTYEDGPRSGVSGRGLLPLLDESTADIKAILVDIVTRSESPTADDLAAVGAPGRVITLELYNAIRALNAAERGFAVNRLAEEVAFARITQRALYARRMLLSGRREANIAQSPAVPSIDRAIAELEGELETLAFDYRMRREVVSYTAQQILTRAQRTTAGAATPMTPTSDIPLLPHGGVKK